LSFKDTGLSVTDGITGNGIWDVASEINWEFSLDQGATWTRGMGSSFEVTGDGAKIIWVRSWDDAGNTSEIVRVNCVLDTTAPGALGVSGQTEGVTSSLRLSGIEPGARWEYSLDEQRSWAPGQCSALGILGNNLSRIWLRQMDLAGNASGAQAFDLRSPNLVTHEASGNPLQPSVLTPGLQTYLIHGVVVRGDLSQQLGSPVEQGKVLFEIAPLDTWRVILKVDERDIDQMAPGMPGKLMLTSLPGQTFDLAVAKITPVATAEDGRNYFRVEARLSGAQSTLRPNMEGVAKVVAGERSLLWIWTHRLPDWLRLAWWKVTP
jgi:hypothetical protein